MPKTLELELMTPAGHLEKAQVSSVKIPLFDGFCGIFPEHAPMTALLGCGVLEIQDIHTKKKVSYLLEDGFVDICSNRVSLLANHAKNIKDIDFTKAKEEYKKLQKEKAIGDEAVKKRLSRLETLRASLALSKNL